MASGDGVGGRADIRVVHDQVGALTGEVLTGTWRDPPLEGI
jgi:hypothetical protein